MGSNSHFYGRLNRLIRLLRGQLATWNKVHIESLNTVRNLLTLESEKELRFLIKAINTGVIFRVWFFLKSGIARQTRLGQIALVVAVILGKI